MAVWKNKASRKSIISRKYHLENAKENVIFFKHRKKKFICLRIVNEKDREIANF